MTSYRQALYAKYSDRLNTTYALTHTRGFPLPCVLLVGLRKMKIPNQLTINNMLLWYVTIHHMIIKMIALPDQSMN